MNFGRKLAVVSEFEAVLGASALSRKNNQVAGDSK